MWQGDDGNKRVAVVQSIDQQRRIANLLFPDDEGRETVSALEIDTGAAHMDSYGVSIGTLVLLCNDNGCPPPTVPVLGQWKPKLESRTESEEEALCRMYGKMIDDPKLTYDVGYKGDMSSLDWWGEVSALNLDGTVQIRLANGQNKSVGLEQLQILSGAFEADYPIVPEDMDVDPIDSLGGMPIPAGMQFGPSAQMFMGGPFGMGMSFMMNGSGGLSDVHEDEEMEYEYEHGSDANDVIDSDWEDESVAGAQKVRPGERMEERLPAVTEDEDEKDSEETERILIDGDVEGHPQPRAPTGNIDDELNGLYGQESEAGPSTKKPTGNVPFAATDSDPAWQHFDVIDEAPSDHHFFTESTSTPTKAYVSRVAKEHRALRSSLPENILVRTYENRTDLMRCLIIGPEGTPYANAPFVFDIYLDPTKFPHDPPLVHFHSHTNGMGRCNRESGAHFPENDGRLTGL